MAPVSITLQLRNIRSFEQARIRFGRFNVIIGANGTGKSTIVEAFEIWRRAKSLTFGAELDQLHGGYFALARRQSEPFSLSLHIELESGPEGGAGFATTLRMTPSGLGTQVVGVAGEAGPGSAEKLVEYLTRAPNLNETERTKHRGGLLANALLSIDTMYFRELNQFAEQVARIQVHLPLETTPLWAARAHDRKAAMRDVQSLLEAPALARFGSNLISVIHALKNERRDVWEDYLLALEAGLELPVEDVQVRATAMGGSAGLFLKLKAQDQPIPAQALSDGQLAWLAWMAMLRLPERPSVLVLDEPDLHMHPRMLARLIMELQEYSKETPVIIATHADAVLDMLDDPAEQTIILERDEAFRTVVRRLDPELFAKWRQDYRGLGEMRAAGVLPHVIKPEPGE